MNEYFLWCSVAFSNCLLDYVEPFLNFSNCFLYTFCVCLWVPQKTHALQEKTKIFYTFPQRQSSIHEEFNNPQRIVLALCFTEFGISGIIFMQGKKFCICCVMDSNWSLNISMRPRPLQMSFKSYAKSEWLWGCFRTRLGWMTLSIAKQTVRGQRRKENLEPKFWSGAVWNFSDRVLFLFCAPCLKEKHLNRRTLYKIDENEY